MKLGGFQKVMDHPAKCPESVPQAQVIMFSPVRKGRERGIWKLKGACYRGESRKTEMSGIS